VWTADSASSTAVALAEAARQSGDAAAAKTAQSLAARSQVVLAAVRALAVPSSVDLWPSLWKLAADIDAMDTEARSLVTRVKGPVGGRLRKLLAEIGRLKREQSQLVRRAVVDADGGATDGDPVTPPTPVESQP
jgi:hypothetical protein